MDRLSDVRLSRRHDITTPILVLGANGKTGSRVAARLTAAGHTVRAGSRAGNPPFDWTDRSTWPAALDGVGAVYVAYFPESASPAPTTTSAPSPPRPNAPA